MHTVSPMYTFSKIPVRFKIPALFSKMTLAVTYRSVVRSQWRLSHHLISCRVLCGNLMLPVLCMAFPEFCETWSSVTVLTKARPSSLSWAIWIQFTPSHPNYLTPTLVWTSHLCLCLASCSKLHISPPNPSRCTSLPYPNNICWAI